MTKLPPAYADLSREPGPKLLKAALVDYGVAEVAGVGSNPVILSWAKQIGVDWYRDDATPWCGLGMAHWAIEAGKTPPANPLRALSWAEFGVKADKASLGDVLVFSRKGGGHVGLYVGESGLFYHVLGANQGDAVTIRQIQKSRCVAVRRPKWAIAQPANVRPIRRAANGAATSTNEA